MGGNGGSGRVQGRHSINTVSSLLADQPQHCCLSGLLSMWTTQDNKSEKQSGTLERKEGVHGRLQEQTLVMPTTQKNKWEKEETGTVRTGPLGDTWR